MRQRGGGIRPVLLVWHLLHLLLLLAGVCLAQTSSRTFGQTCRQDVDCKKTDSLLKCDFQSSTSASSVCACVTGHVWRAGACREAADGVLGGRGGSNGKRDQDEGSKKAALIITIVVPLVAVAVVVTCVAVLCCYWVQVAASSAEKEVTKRDKYDVELDFYGANHIDDDGGDGDDSSDDDDDDSSSEDDEEKNKHRTRMVRKNSPKLEAAVQAAADDGDKAVPQLKVNGVKETALTNGHVLNKTTSLPNGDVSTRAFPTGAPTPVMERSPMRENPSYQATMRQLLTQNSDPATSGSRPASAFFLSNTRPGTALPYRPASGLLNPKDRPTSASGRRPVGFIGPYISDSSRLPSRSASPRPPSASSNMGVAAIPHPGDLSELYDKIAAIADKEEKDKEEKEKRRKEAAKARKGNNTGIEDIKLVRRAASAFKKRRNLKKVKEDQKRKGGKKKNSSKKFESLVEQIMRSRQEEDRRPKTRHANRRNNRNNANGRAAGRRDSKSSEGSSSERSSSNQSRITTASTVGRPESVAQRILRERQAKRIQTKTPTTEVIRPPPSVAQRRASLASTQGPLPLHVTLRQASAKPFTRSQLTERIKQQVHLSAVKNYRAPTLSAVQMAQLANPSPPPAPPVDRGDVKPVKSILKKDNGGSNGASANSNSVKMANGSAPASSKKKQGRVNYAFDDDGGGGADGGGHVRSVKAEVYVI